ncbi:hypothetical protein AQV86_05430 [Nanohaloarchaea archaeon SG9]|nr:hypothetical protein AQV86_05430 [Nanohaloarchaea archaeon SG9]
MEEVDYEDELKEVPNPDISKVREYYKDFKSEIDEDQKRKELRDSLDTRKTHDSLVGKIASAFHQAEEAEGSDTGYEFAFTEPLEERGIPNGDILLVKEEEEGIKLCIVECKSGSKYPKWFNQISKIKEQLQEEDNRREIKAQIDCRDKEINFIQYVIATSGRNLSDVDPSRYEANYPDSIAIWGVDEIQQSLYAKNGYTCNDKDIASKVGEGIDYGRVENPIKYTISSHPVIILQSVLFDIIKSNAENSRFKEFNEEEFYEEFEKNLQMGVEGSNKNDLVNGVIESILSFGEDIRIISSDEEDLRGTKDYRIMFRGKKPPMARKAVKEKFLRNRPVRRVAEDAFRQALEKYRNEDKQGGLDDFT